MEVKRERLAIAPAGTDLSNEDFRIRQLRARDMLRGDLGDDDLEKYVEERIMTTTLDKAVAWARSNALFPATFGLACCAIEMMSIVAARVDIARFGFEAFRASPRQADLLILSGRVSIKMAPVVRRIYDQMLEPKWAIAMGACSSSMGVFNNYAIVPADKFMPVDIHVPGCPPRPEALMHGILKLRKMIQEDPDMGWRARYQAYGTEEVVPGERIPPTRPEPSDGDQRLPAGEHRRCLTRPAWNCSPRSCASSIAGSVLETVYFRDKGQIVVKPAAIRATLEHLRAKGFAMLVSVHGVDYYPEEPRLGVHYELLDMDSVDRLTVKLRVPVADPVVPSVTPGWPTANHQEREVYDMFGVVFEGHPDLRRILMPEDYEGHPQRRDFPIGGEPVLFTIDEAEGTAYTQ